MTWALACRNVVTGYGDSIVLNTVNLNVKPGEVYALIGKNGAGKSTFLKAVIGLLACHSGTIEMFGQDITGWPTHRIIAHGITYAPQENAFFQNSVWRTTLDWGAWHLAIDNICYAVTKWFRCFHSSASICGRERERSVAANRRW